MRQGPLPGQSCHYPGRPALKRLQTQWRNGGNVRCSGSEFQAPSALSDRVIQIYTVCQAPHIVPSAQEARARQTTVSDIQKCPPQSSPGDFLNADEPKVGIGGENQACSIQHVSMCTTSMEDGTAESMKLPRAHKSPAPKPSRVHTFILTHMGFLCKDAHTSGNQKAGDQGRRGTLAAYPTGL